jgi:hypothetical protein
LIYTAFTHWEKFLANLHFIEHIPGRIKLYLANQGGMGDDLSHNPYISGNSRHLRRRMCQTPILHIWGGWAVHDRFAQGLGAPKTATYGRLGCILGCIARPVGPVAQLITLSFVGGVTPSQVHGISML